MNRNCQKHVTEKELILLANGEIGVKDRARVDEHIASCWSCRHEQTVIERTIDAFMARRGRELPRELPPIAPRRAELASLLARAGEESRWTVWRCLLSAMRIERAPGVSAWVAATSSLMCLLLFYFYVVRPPAVSAEELVARAVASHSLSPISEVAIRINGVAYRPVLQGGPSTAAELSILIRIARLDSGDPLNAAAFATWRDTLSVKKDDVQRARDELTLTTRDLGSGPVRKAELTVRASTFRPVSEQWEFRSGDVIEIAEAVSGAAALPKPKLTEPAPPVASTLPIVSAPAATSPTASNTDPPAANPSPEALAELELAVRVALHNIGADLGEDIRIRRTENQVNVDARVETIARKDQLTKLLEQLPSVRVEAKTFEEESQRSPAEPVAPSTLIHVAPRPILDDELVSRFPNHEDRTEFVNRSLATAGDAAAEAWALRTLAQRYSDREITLLRAESLQTFGLLLSINLDRLAGSVSALQSQLTPFLKPVVDLPFSNYTAPPDWRETAGLLAAQVSTTQKHVVQSLSGAGDDAPPADRAARQLTAHLADVSQLLETLRNQVQAYMMRLPAGRKE